MISLDLMSLSQREVDAARGIPIVGAAHLPAGDSNGHGKHFRNWMWALITALSLWATSRAWVHGWELATLPDRVGQLEQARADEMTWRLKHEQEKAREFEALMATQQEILKELRRRKR